MARGATLQVPEPWVGSTPQEKQAIEDVAAYVESFENGIGPEFRERNDRFYRQYRGFKKFKNVWEAAGPNDRDVAIKDGARQWGSNLHVPYAFAIVELMTARAIAHRPKMQYLARQEKWAQNVENVQMLIDAQQQQVELDLEYQDVMKDGYIYGIGIGKSYWRKEYTQRRRARRRMFRPGQYVPGKLENVCVFDDPDFDHVDPYDFMWDPMGDSTSRGHGRRCEWVVHRSWFSLKQCLDRIKASAWNTDSAQKLDEDTLRGMGGRQRYDEIWIDRMMASGFSQMQAGADIRGEQLHEYWEWHDGERVIGVLDGQVCVMMGENPCVGELPFHIYRPTKVAKQMVGIGEIEPIESLSRELDLLRSMQLDAGIIAMCAGYAYDDGAIDEEDLVFGPASAVRVTNARPQDALWPLPKPDLPSSSFQNAANIAADIERVSGMTDALADQQGPGISTATEAQLVQAALSRRVELKSRRFEAEVIRHNAKVWLYLDQRMILDDRTYGRPAPMGDDPLDAAQHSRFEWFEMGPGEIEGEFEIIPEGGSMAAENVQQKRQDAIQILNTFGQNPYIDPRAPLMEALKKFDIVNPQNWLAQKNPPIPPAALDTLVKAGVDPKLVEFAVKSAQRMDPRLPNPEDTQVPA